MKYTIGIIVTIVIIASAAFFVTSQKQSKVTNTQSPSIQPTISTTLGMSPTQKTVVISPSVSITTKSDNNSKFTPEFRARVRSSFINSCKEKVGQEYEKACNCGADYLAAHYTDIELEKVYIEYHSSNTIPKEIQAAYNACK